MNQMYKFTSPGEPFNGYASSNDTELTHSIVVEENWIKYRLMSNEVILVSVKFDFQQFKTHNNYYDQTLWAFDDEAIKQSIVELNESENKNNFYYTVFNDDIIPVFKKTLSLKLPKIFQTPGLNACALIRFFVKSVNINSEELDIIFATGANTNVSYYYNDEAITPQILDKYMTLVSDITYTTDKDNSTINPGDEINVTVSTDQTITYVYVEPISALVNKTIVPIVNGTGTFKIYTADLESGDIVSVKIAHKYVAGVTSLIKTIS
jgi:hypothetical protein